MHITFYGNKRWYNDLGELHRIEGPAVIDNDGYVAYYLGGLYHSKEKWFDCLTTAEKLEAAWNL